MTENEIKNTKEWIEDFIETYALSNQETIEFKKAVACLEELQQYRAIGTVEEILNTFNAQQLKIASQHNELEEYRAIGTVKGYERAVESATENYKLYREYRTKVQNFEVIGTIEEFKALKEKSVAKKTIIHGLGQRYCPVCKCGGADHFYCTRCGQKLG